ncbi:type II toxin-antitoxin system toxin DNA ADP-ribosyl transferase DarT [Desulfovibrio caledoniensis]
MTWIYHFTHYENLNSILATGGLKCDSDMVNKGHAIVGNRDIKTRRFKKNVTVPPNGVVADYVPFYFAPRSPMLYSIHRGNVPECDYGQKEVIYLCTTVEDVVSKAECCFTDRNAALTFASFYKDVGQLHNVVDMPLMSEKMWNNTPTDLDRMERRMAEFLVHRFFLWELVRFIGVASVEVKNYVDGLLQSSGKNVATDIRTDWYY